MFFCALFLIASNQANANLSGEFSVNGLYEVYLSTDDSVQGELIASGNDWSAVHSLALQNLSNGVDYYLHVRAQDVSGAGAFIGDFTINNSQHTFANGLSTLSTNTDHWQVSTTGWSNYTSTNGYGNNGDAPWGTRAGISNTAQWIWSADNSADDIVYFTTKITAQYQCSSFGTLQAIGLSIDSTGSITTMENIGDAFSVYKAWVADGSPATGLIANGTYNIAVSGASNVDRIDFAGHNNLWYPNSLPYPGYTSIGSRSNTLVYTTGTISLKAGDYTIFVQSDDGFSLKLNTISGDDIVFNKFGGSPNTGASNELIFVNTTPNAVTGGSFTLSQDSIFELEDMYFERVGGDFHEISITDNIINTQLAADYELFAHGALNGKVTFGCAQPQVQAGQVTLRNTRTEPAFTAVCFDTPFNEVPRVFSIPATPNQKDRLNLRIRNITQTGFEIAQVQSPDRTDSEPPSGNDSQTVDFFAATDGTYMLDGGAKMQVGGIDTQLFVTKLLPTADTGKETIDISNIKFSENPAIIHNIQTMNNETNPFPFSEPFIGTNVDSVNANQFSISLERSEAITGSITNNETIAYMAISEGKNGTLNNALSYESFVTPTNIAGTDTCRAINFVNNYSAAPLIVAGKNTRIGIDGGWIRRCSLNNTSVGFAVVEDQDIDTEGTHVDESVAGLAISGAVTNQTCAVQPSSILYYKIEHNSQGLTCESANVTIKACVNEDCSILSTQQTSLDLLANGNVVGNQTFTGSTIITFNNPSEETVSLSLANIMVTPKNPTKCDAQGVSTCQISFKDAGFRFIYGNNNDVVVPNQFAGDNFTQELKLQAVENNQGVCSALLSGTQTIALSQKNIQPADTGGLAFNVDSQSIAKYPNQSNISLSFDSNGIAILPNVLYLDAGQISLQASYNNAGVSIQGESNNFWVSPAELRIDASAGVTALNGNNASAQPTHKAGEVFDLSVTALNRLGQVTLNYQPGQIQAKVSRLKPIGSGSVSGSLLLNENNSFAADINSQFTNVVLAGFVNGVSNYSNAQYSEVGVIALDIQDTNYANIGITVPANEITIGRFTPHHFTTQIINNGLLQATCGTNIGFSAYSGQMDEATMSVGAISYLTNPIYEIRALNKQNQTTRNYYNDGSDDFMKLVAGDINVSAPSSDEFATGVNGTPLTINAVVNTGTLSRNNLNVTPSTALSRGFLHYQLSSNDHFVYPRSANSKVAPFTSSIQIPLVSVVDSDGIAATSFGVASPTGLAIRYGRLVLENSFGPETSNIAQTLQLQHYNGSIFVNSTDNSCVNYQKSSMSLASISLTPSLTTILADFDSGPFNNGQSKDLVLQATGEGNQGQMRIFYDAYDWLEYDWDNDTIDDNDPSSVVDFGIFRGDDRTLHWRENF